MIEPKKHAASNSPEHADSVDSQALESESTSAVRVSGHRRLWLGAGAAALLTGAAISAWRLQDAQPEDEGVKTLLQQNYPIVAGAAHKGDLRSMSLKSLKGKTAMVNFWATWCPPCIEEMPDLSKLADTWHREFGEKVLTLGIGIDSVANIQKFSEKLPVSYPLLAANAQGLELIRLLGNPSGGLPFSIIINPRGMVTERISGRFDVKMLDSKVRNTLAERA